MTGYKKFQFVFILFLADVLHSAVKTEKRKRREGLKPKQYFVFQNKFKFRVFSFVKIIKTGQCSVLVCKVFNL